MRLTLRTLLAYLDNTLDSQDAEALKLKLSESSFATQLVQRIRDSLNNQMLAAPAPDAVGPVEDANAISEYLDSTLSSEQVSEIERACLESDPHLAEAAACHQILTMVLGKPANVSAELRQRIYQLPDRSIEEITSGESFSSLAVPEEPSPVGPWADDVPTADATISPEQHVEPVGVADSGVSDAPTRLREMQGAEDPLSTSAATAGTGPTIAGSKPRSITDAEIYGGSIRPSRIAPWLVSLAIAAVLLFALSQIFAPLLARNKEVAEAQNGEIGTVETLGSEDQLSATDDVAPPAEDLKSTEDPSAEDRSADLPAETTTESLEESDVDSESPPSATTSTPDDPAGGEETPAAVANVDGDEPATNDPANDKLAAGDGEQPMTERPVDPIETDPVAESEVSPPTDEDLASTDPPIPPGPDDDPPPEPEPEQPNSDNGVQVAKLTSSESLIATMGDQQWVSLKRDAPINSESVLVCAPTFRAEMVSANQLLTTMIGPARLSWRSDNDGNQLHLETGRVLLSAGEPGSTVSMVLAGQAISITFAEAAHVAAVHVAHLRQPGFDPLDAENHTPVRVITAVQGTITVSGAKNDEEGSGKLETGQQWLMYGSEAPTVTDLEQLPAWVEQPDDSDLTLEANARKGLLELLSEGDQSLEIALREATSFRQSEVAALAGQTLLALRKGDVYFDAVGILNQPKQRAYWPDHFLALQAAIDEGVESASSLYASIQRTNLANGEAIMRLLAGYSQQQLVDGGDLELVEMLDSTSMAVRVLALENLRKITGTTLYFRAEQDNAVRRTQGIKKWTTRQRKGDIRWPE